MCIRGGCNHCNIWAHKRRDCRKLTAEIAKKGGPKGKAGGKGGPTGGKGPAAGTIAEVGAEDDHGAGELLAGAIAGWAPGFHGWELGRLLTSDAAAH